METLDRYLHAVEFWLPKEQKEDIIAELSEDIHSQIEERQEQLGRSLNETELDALLKQRGRPVLVANRYLPKQFLIGPVLFPVYLFVLKVVALCYLVPWVLVFISVYVANHGRSAWVAAILAATSSLWTVAFIALGVATLVFAILERVEAKSHFLEDWNPRSLPPVRDPNKISRSTSVAQIVVYLVGVLWCLGEFSSPTFLNGPAIRISLAPNWVYFFWAFVLLTLAQTGLAALNLVRPYWTTQRAMSLLALDAVGSVLFCWLMKADVLTNIAIANLGPAQTLAINNAVHLWMARAFPIAVIIGVIAMVTDIYRVLRVNRKSVGQNRNATAAMASLLL